MNYKLFILLFTLITYHSAQLITPNTCSSLGENAPLTERDCQIYVLKIGFCCYLTITNEEIDPNKPGDIITIKKQACIFANSKDPNERQNLVNSLQHLGKEVLIECSGQNHAFSLAGIILILIIILNT